jgi:colanic acid/amylovoran biosynthesis protein
VQIVLTNFHNDDNRGSCALTWAALDVLLKAFPHARIGIEPIATLRNEVAGAARENPFRHTNRRYPEIEVLPPLFEGRGRPALIRASLLAWRVVKVLQSDVIRPERHPTLEWIRNSNLAVSRGGLIFHTIPPTLRGDVGFLIRTLGILAAQQFGVPVVLLGMHAGPFRTSAGKRLFRGIAGGSALALPRDAISSAEFESITGRSDSLRLPDSVFGLRLPVIDMSRVFSSRGLRPELTTLALVVSSELTESAGSHAARLANAALALREARVIDQILIVVQAERDRDISRLLANLVGESPAMVVDEDLDPAQLVAVYSACSMVLSSRLHSVIFAFLGGTPAVSVATGLTFKEGAVLSLVGLGDLCVPVDHDHQILVDLCTRVCRTPEAIRERIASAVASARQALSTVPGLLRGLSGSRLHPEGALVQERV